MGHLILSGGGDKEQSKEIDQYFIEHINPSKPLLYIPIAMNGIIPYEECFKWANSVFNPFGIDIIMWTNVDNKSFDDLKQFSAIYIGGGNTFNLLREFRISQFDSLLKEYIENDGIVYGGSAGAIILGSNIMTCAHMDPNNTDLQSINGLNLISDYSIWCHYEAENESLISGFIKDYKKSVIALRDGTGVAVSDEGIKVIGNSSAISFTNKGKVLTHPGSFI
ncbi:dipeptidase E [Virgibacillus subterraneus]|uniref:Dipeptidase E n=1 Tax=Virgibacillus subterraneus TaxID=621109 RepID=A0A1H9FHE3_9BACI|nr:Type 1 glutamine amidotransferase-like domain-containing protein [Virgibacillus subterraneus]SEQ37225.1 dipeptidase E [Virgibacillus subterraneus]